MQYQPVTDKEYNERMLLPEGAYAYEVIAAADDVSKSSGAEMIVLELLIHASDGSNRKVRAYLVGSDKGRFQVRAFAESAKLTEKYKSGQLTADDCVGRSGWLRLKVEAGRPKDDGSGNWPDKNTVGSFLDREPGQAKASVGYVRTEPSERAKANLPPEGADDDSDSVPF